MSGPHSSTVVQCEKRGFTLVELFVTVAVITILAGLILPVFAQTREKTRSTTCLSNALQLGAAVMLYAQDNDEQVVPSVIGELDPASPSAVDHLITWSSLLEPYVKHRRVFYCPSFSLDRLIRADTARDCYGPGNAGLFHPTGVTSARTAGLQTTLALP